MRDLPRDLPTLQDLVHRSRFGAADDDAIETLRSVRAGIARDLRVTPETALAGIWRDLSPFHRLLLESPLRDEFPTPEDQKTAAALRDELPSVWDEPLAAGRWLAAMLYHRPFELPTPLDLPRVPDWLRPNWLRYLLEAPVFLNPGDADKHLRHTRRMVAHVHAQLEQSPADRFWLEAASSLLPRLKIYPLYFTAADLHPLMVQRGDLLDRVLRAAGHAVDHSFARHPASRRIRLGLLCDSILDGAHITLPLYEHLDRERFEVVLLCSRQDESPQEQYCVSRLDRVVRVSEELRELVAAVRAEDLDLLFVVPNVASTNTRLTKAAAHRLARVQFTHFTSPVTTGLRTMDRFLSGALSEPPDAPRHYREKLALLEGPGFCFDYSCTPARSELRFERAALGIDGRAIVFASGANYHKLVPELMEIWLRILQATPSSVLLLYPFGTWSDSYPTASWTRRSNEHFRRNGIDPRRLVVVPRLPGRAAVIALLKVADVYLDSFPHSGSHSLFEAMEATVPAVALQGSTLRGRHGCAILAEMRLDEMIARDVDGYVALAERLGRDESVRAAWAERIAAALKRVPRFLDARRFARDLAPLYEQWIAEQSEESRGLCSP